MIFRYEEDRWPVAMIVSGVLLSLMAFSDHGFMGWGFGFAGLLLRSLVPIHQHSHSHLSTFNDESMNALYDLILSIGGGNLTSMWRVHHGMGHHVDYLDQKNDVEGNLRFGQNIPYRRFVFAVLGSSLSLVDSFKLLKRFPTVVRRKHQFAIIRQLSLQLAVFLIFMLIDWKVTLVMFLLPNFILKMAVFWFSYGQHDDLPMTSVYDSSTTKFKFGQLLLNVEHHTAHHERPGLHWSRLAARTEEILPLIDPRCVRR